MNEGANSASAGVKMDSVSFGFGSIGNLGIARIMAAPRMIDHVYSFDFSHLA